MNVQLQIEEMPNYLAARFTGPTKEAWHEFASIAGRCKRARKNKLLLDFTETCGDLSLTDRYALASKAEVFIVFKLIKVAVVGRPEQFDYKRFGEMVARNRWVNARLFTSVEDAEKWLKTPARRRRPLTRTSPRT
jgi:hypothetical protein